MCWLLSKCEEWSWLAYPEPHLKGSYTTFHFLKQPAVWLENLESLTEELCYRCLACHEDSFFDSVNRIYVSLEMIREMQDPLFSFVQDNDGACPVILSLPPHNLLFMLPWHQAWSSWSVSQEKACGRQSVSLHNHRSTVQQYPRPWLAENQLAILQTWWISSYHLVNTVGWREGGGGRGTKCHWLDSFVRISKTNGMNNHETKINTAFKTVMKS